MMSPRDLNYIFRAQMAAVRVEDPRRDDYYAHELWFRRTQTSSGNGKGKGGNGGKAKTGDDKTEALREKTKAWQAENSVLGQMTKSSVGAPRQLLVMPTAGDDEDEDGTDAANRFKSTRWGARAVIDRGMRAIVKLIEISREGRDAQDPDGSDAANGGGSAAPVAALCDALCLRDNGAADDAGAGAGGASGGGAAAGAGSGKCTVDVGRLLKVVKISKGRTMVCRAFPLVGRERSQTLLTATMCNLPSFVCTALTYEHKIAKKLKKAKGGGEAPPMDRESAFQLAQLQRLDVRTADTMARAASVLSATGAVAVLAALVEAYTPSAMRQLLETQNGAIAIQALVTRGEHIASEVAAGVDGMAAVAASW